MNDRPLRWAPALMLLAGQLAFGSAHAAPAVFDDEPNDVARSAQRWLAAWQVCDGPEIARQLPHAVRSAWLEHARWERDHGVDSSICVNPVRRAALGLPWAAPGTPDPAGQAAALFGEICRQARDAVAPLLRDLEFVGSTRQPGLQLSRFQRRGGPRIEVVATAGPEGLELGIELPIAKDPVHEDCLGADELPFAGPGTLRTAPALIAERTDRQIAILQQELDLALSERGHAEARIHIARMLMSKWRWQSNPAVPSPLERIAPGTRELRLLKAQELLASVLRNAPTARTDLAEAQLELGLGYLKARFAPARPSLRKALHWLSLAADNGNAEAATQLARIHQHGVGGVARDDALALRYKELAVRHSGHHRRQVNDLAWTLAVATSDALRDPPRALRLQLELVRAVLESRPLNFDDARKYGLKWYEVTTLAAARCATGDLDEAKRLAEIGIAIHDAANAGETSLASDPHVRAWQAGHCLYAPDAIIAAEIDPRLDIRAD